MDFIEKLIRLSYHPDYLPIFFLFPLGVVLFCFVLAILLILLNFASLLTISLVMVFGVALFGFWTFLFFKRKYFLRKGMKPKSSKFHFNKDISEKLTFGAMNFGFELEEQSKGIDVGSVNKLKISGVFDGVPFVIKRSYEVSVSDNSGMHSMFIGFGVEKKENFSISLEDLVLNNPIKCMQKKRVLFRVRLILLTIFRDNELVSSIDFMDGSMSVTVCDEYEVALKLNDVLRILASVARTYNEN